ncbi:MAG: transglycosylase domain-containing protein [Bifidobacteriaceae bacterium]|jgi:membrane peptidoglycan carboxypeptidase|nr:transglycosylase domain-containing protein [Bifidobacteriaceae bacterium]
MKQKFGSFAGLLGCTALLAAFFVLFLSPAVIFAKSANTNIDNYFNTLPSSLLNTSLSNASDLYASDGVTKLATFYTENRIEVPLEKISPYMKYAVLSREDHRFYDHKGVDPKGIMRALVSNIKGKVGGSSDDSQGGSTLTQQYVKNLGIAQGLSNHDPIAVYQAREQSIFRKIKEAYIAINIEKKLNNKDKILEGYLNAAQFGINSYGVEVAAQHFFSIPASDLDIAQAATIAMITKSPGSYDPTVNISNAEFQRNIVIGLMAQHGYITDEEAAQAKSKSLADSLEIKDTKTGCEAAGNAAFFCDYVKRTILNSSAFGKNSEDRTAFLFQGGLKITTTLNLDIQNAAYDEIVKAIPVKDPSQYEIALSSVEPGTGKVISMVQNRNFTNELVSTDTLTQEEKDITTSINYNVNQKLGGGTGFPPGSTIKGLTLATWLKNGHSLNEIIDGEKQTFKSADFQCGTPIIPWEPQNAANSGYGYFTPLVGLNNSYNMVYIRMGSKLGLCEIASTYTKMGFRQSFEGQELLTSQSSSSYQPTLLIGGTNTTPLDMANAYATIASGGIHCEPIVITKIENSDGEEVDIPDAGCERVLDEDVAHTAAYALKTNTTSGSGRVFGRLADGRDAGVKTGTTDGPNDLWAVGITTGLSSALWMGNAQGLKPFSHVTVGGRYYAIWYGSTLAAPTMRNYYNRAIAFYPAGSFGSPASRLMGTTCTFTDKKKCDVKKVEELDEFGNPIPGTEVSANDAAKRAAEAGLAAR